MSILIFNNPVLKYWLPIDKEAKEDYNYLSDFLEGIDSILLDIISQGTKTSPY